MNYLEKSKEIVLDYIKNKSNADVSDSQLYVVWSCKTLQNFKALLFSPIIKEMYFELTYNGDKNEWYLDIYRKWENVCIKGSN